MTMSNLLSKIKKSRKARVIVVAIALIPLIYAGALVWANQDPVHNLSNVPAAIVNNDQPTTANGATVELGATLTEELTSSTEDTNFDWTEMDAAEAEAALKSGDVLAVLAIPEDFSANAVSPGADAPLDAAAATLHIETNDGANLIAGSIATSIGTAVRTTLATQVSDEYLQNIYVGFTTIHGKITEASDGAQTLSDGASSANDGANELVVGLDALANGTVQLNSGAQTLADGASDVNDGANALAAGLRTLDANTSVLPAQATQLNTGAQRVAAGATDLATGLSTLAPATVSLADGSDTALTGATALQNNLITLSGQTPALATATDRVSVGLTALLENYDSMTDQQRMDALTALSTPASAAATGAAQTNTAVQGLTSGATALVGSVETKTGLAILQAGAHSVADGTATLSTGAATLNSGAAELAGGTATLSTQVPQLVAAIQSASSGASTLANGTDTLTSGATTLASGTATVSDGTAAAADGASTLATGTTQLAEGADELSTGLATGLAEIPSYTDAETEHLSTVTSQPVTLETDRINEVPAYGWGLAPYFIALALWVGALAFYLMMPALSKKAIAGRGSIALVALRSYLPGALMALAQSVFVVLILRAVGIEAANPWGLLGMIALTSLTFVAINQALIALLGAPGRFLGLILIVLQLAAAGGTYPIQTAPAFFQAIHPWLPLTYSVEGFRSLIAGGDIGITQGIWVLLAWLAGALGVTVLASIRERRALTTAALPAELRATAAA